jgi:hypothetical protein
MHYIIDNFLPEPCFKGILKYALSSSYTYSPHTAHEDIHTKDPFDYQFVKIVTYFDEEAKHYKGVPREDLNKFFPFFDKLEVKNMLRCKINCNPFSNKNHELGWHTDVEEAPEDCWFSCILYLTTCDGCTLLKTKDQTVKVESVANRVFLFPSIWSHTACTPTNVKARFIVNTVFEIDTDKKPKWMS